MVGRAVAWILVVLALIAGGRDALIYWQTGNYAPTELGAIWSAVDGASLAFVHAALDRYLFPALWQDGLVPLLLWPAWAVLAGAAAVVAALFGRRRKHRWRSGSLG